MRSAAAAVAIVLAMMGGGAACGMCGNTFIAEHLSPDSAHEVIIFQRHCGATTGYTTHVLLSETLPERGVTPLGTGNVLIVDDNAASVDLKVRWIDTKTVELSHRKTRIDTRRPEVYGIEIRYVEHP